MTTYMLAGGGTAGHVNPLLALADEISSREPQSHMLVLGTKEGLEAELVPARGHELHTIERLPFPRRPNRYALGFWPRYRAAIAQVRELIRTHNVDVVVGFGGYASAPAYQAAAAEKVPLVIHEANAVVGLANRLGARKADRVAVTFASTPLKGAHVTGMPLRSEIAKLDRDAMRAEARHHFGLRPDLPTLLVTGGSLGARTLNTAVSAASQRIVDSGAQVLHIWGGLTEMTAPDIADIHVMKYCDRMDLALSACDLAVSRAGSTTVSELSALGVPAILVPYAVGNGEQSKNAADLVAAGGAVLVGDSDFTEQWVVEHVIPLLHNEQALTEMSANARRVGMRDGTARLYDLVQDALADHATRARRAR